MKRPMTIAVRCTCSFCSTEADGCVELEQSRRGRVALSDDVDLPSGWTWYDWHDDSSRTPMCPACTENRS